MQPTVEFGYYGFCFLVSTIAFLLIGLWYVLPRLARLPRDAALAPLLLFSAFRVNGLYFLVPGVASPDIPKEFAVPTAYGDAAAAVLAIFAAIVLRYRLPGGIALTWVYGVLGSLDLLNAFAQVAIHGVQPGQFAGAWILPAINVPSLMVAHLLVFILLLRARRSEK